MSEGPGLWEALTAGRLRMGCVGPCAQVLHVSRYNLVSYALGWRAWIRAMFKLLTGGLRRIA